MTRRITDSELLLISKAKQEKLKNYSEGVSLAARSGKSIEELRVKVAKDRLALAQQQLIAAKKAIDSTSSLSRTAVSRAYYAMYHAARAATYISFGGDDHEEHSKLPTQLPDDFPDVQNWKIKIKNARLDRNRADYDPYPKKDSEFKECAETLYADARSFLRSAKDYVQTKSTES